MRDAWLRSSPWASPGGAAGVVACVPQRLDLPAAAGPAAAPVPGPAGQLGALGGRGPASRLAELHRGHGGRALLADHPHGHRGQPAHGPGGGLRRAGGHLPGQRRRPVQPAGPCPARRGPLAQAWLLGLAWYFLEYVYALVAGFPWLPLGGALAAWPLWIQAADVTGAYLLAGLWVTVILSLRHWRRPACVCTGLLLAALLLGYGAWRLHTTPLEDDPRGEDSVAVLFAEGNIDQNQKWVPAYQRRTVETYLRLTQAELARIPAKSPSSSGPKRPCPSISTTTASCPHWCAIWPAGPEPPADRRARLPV